MTAVLLGSTSFVRNKRLVDELSSQTNRLATNLHNIDISNMDPTAVLPSLNNARQITRRLQSQSEEDIPPSMGFGLYQGDKLVQAAETAYRRILTDALMPRLMTKLENQIMENSDNVQMLREALRVYLMLGDTENYNGPMVEAWISQDLDQNLSTGVSSEQIAALKQHLTILLAKRPAPLPRPLDEKLIRWAKQLLPKASLVIRDYDQPNQETSNARISDFRIDENRIIDGSMIPVRQYFTPLNNTRSDQEKTFSDLRFTPIELGSNERFLIGADAPTKFSGSNFIFLQHDVLNPHVYLEGLPASTSEPCIQKPQKVFAVSTKLALEAKHNIANLCQFCDTDHFRCSSRLQWA